jgi:hypothetical protein
VIGGPLRLAVIETLGSPRWWAVGLAGFLARGGILVFTIPVVVLPSVVGLTTFIGPNSVTAAGLAPRFVALLAATVVTVAAWILLGTLVAAAVDRALVRAVVGIDRPGDPSGTDRGPGLTRLFVIRLACLVPFGVGLAVGGYRLGDVGYQELILPSDSTTPFVIRVLLAAPEVVALLVLTWLASESLGAVAVRLAIVDGRTAVGSLAAGLGWIVRQPVRSSAVTLATVLGSLIVVGPAVVATVVVWGGVRAVLLGTADPVAALAVVALFAITWAGGLALAGIAATWRSAAWSLAVVEDHRGGGPAPAEGGTL